LPTKKRFPHVDKIIVGNHAGELAKAAVGPNTFVAIVTQGNEYDFECLKVVIRSNAAYVVLFPASPRGPSFSAVLKK